MYELIYKLIYNPLYINKCKRAFKSAIFLKKRLRYKCFSET